MPETTAVAEEEQVQAEEPQVAEEEQQEPKRDEFLDVLYTDLGVDIAPPPAEEEEGEEEKPEAEAEPEPEPPAEEEKAEEKAEEKPKKRFNVKGPDLSQADIRKAVREEINHLPPPLPTAPEPEPEPVDDLEGYIPEQQEEIELARYAESIDPKKYKGMSDGLIKFYNDLDSYIDKSEDEDRTFDENDEAFMQWVEQNKPSISRVDQRKLERQMIKDQALTEARSEFDSKNQELEEKIRQVSDRPKAEKEFNRYEQLLDEESPEEGDGLAQTLHQREMADARRVGEEYLDLFYGLKTYNENNSLHKWIVDFVTQQSDAFSKHGGEHLIRTGEDGVSKEFVPPSEYGNVDSNRHWTFTSSDIMDIMGNYFQTRATDSIKVEEERLEKMGFVRQGKKKSQAKAKKEELKATESPRATNSPSPGAATTDGVEEELSPGEDVLDRLGINFNPDSLT